MPVNVTYLATRHGISRCIINVKEIKVDLFSIYIYKVANM